MIFMRNFTLQLERFEGGTCQDTSRLRIYLRVRLPILLVLHVLCTLWLFPVAHPETLDYIAYGIALFMIVISVAAFITVHRLSPYGYYCMIAFSLFNALRCLAVAGGCLYSIFIQPLPFDGTNEKADMLLSIFSVPMFFIMLIELRGIRVHVLHMLFMRRIKPLFVTTGI